MTDFKELPEWEKAHSLTVAVYEITDKFPERELQGITQQIRLASAAVPIKIAQGCVKYEREEQIKLFELAIDAAIELEYYLLLSYELDFLNIADYDRLVSSVVEVKEKLESLIERMKTNS
ncbi:four helix bundle protein [Aerosakkonema funiforme]|uniref:Four helix bundle protein n=1 Tax=Aerosakkonema funiforme FACHB-1375 TaxID=2949571 RepID=A0A926VL40_9CYAN|nr:four helix bundle protein [Aerosakkonema funiforme]MBD2185698.1 four helix bundle protein [Aerosakkonema funiforme FACHB-1375]